MKRLLESLSDWYSGLNKKAAVYTMATIAAIILLVFAAVCFPILTLILLVICLLAIICSFVYFIIELIYTFFDVMID